MKTMNFLFGVMFIISFSATKMNSKQSTHYGIVALYECFSLPPEVSGVDWIGTMKSFEVDEDLKGRWLIPVGNTTPLDTSWLAAPLSANQTEWNYSLKIGPNKDEQTIELVLMSDKRNLISPFNGYSLKIEASNKKTLLFNRVDSGKQITLFQKTLPETDSSDVFRVQIVRKGTGKWLVLGGYEHKGLSLIARIQDELYDTSSYTGIRYVNAGKSTQAIKLAPLLILHLPDEFEITTQYAEPTYGDIIINELMFNPLQARYDGGTDQAQYVELLNRSTKRMSLSGLRLRTRSATSSSSSTISYNLDQQYVEPGKHIVLLADTSSIAGSRVVRFFGYNPEALYGISKRLTLSLGTNAGSVVLIDKTGLVIDSLNYTSAMHQPSVRDSRGVSLERINSKVETLDPWNWSSHAGSLGGSPGRVNSVSANSSQIKNDLLLSTSPNPFSPDGDGRDEISTLKINTPTPGWLVKAQIIDRQGRRVRTLVNGERLGRESEIYWNGLDDMGRFVRTGIYVAIVEVWHLERRERMSGKHAIALVQKGL